MIGKGWVVAAGLAVCAACLSIGFGSGWWVNGLRWEGRVASDRLDAEAAGAQLRYQQEAAREAIRERQEEADRAAALEEKLADAEAAVVTVEVIRYVQDDTTGACVLPGGWVRIHNRAAGVSGAAEAGDAAGAVDAATGPAVTDRDALPVVAENYARARECIARLQGLQAWVAEGVK